MILPAFFLTAGLPLGHVRAGARQTQTHPDIPVPKGWAGAVVQMIPFRDWVLVF